MVKRRDMKEQAALEDATSGDSVDRMLSPKVTDDRTESQDAMDQPDWLGLARDTYEDSTNFIDSSLRVQWERNERAFQSRHPANSKYRSDDFRHRSKIFRPKTRSMIRAGEAAIAQAFFRNEDVISIDPIDESNKEQSAAADLWKEVMQYRLTTPNKRIGIPWFLNLVGGYQDAQKYGFVCSKQWWQFRDRTKNLRVPDFDQETGQPIIDEEGRPVFRTEKTREVVFDRPCMSLIPPENIRIDRAASWVDPINSSPFCIVLHPMYIDECELRMEETDPKTGQPIWKDIGRSALKQSASRHLWDTTRANREDNRDDSKENEIKTDEFYTVWVHENFVRWRGEEYVYYTAGVHHLLSDPLPLEEVYPHCTDGDRPIVMGYALLETHKIYPIGKPELVQNLQMEANEVANLRLDNVKLAINKRYLVARGKQVDLRSLIRNSSNSITLVSDTEADVKVLETRDVTQSSYQEQSRIDLDIDDVAGSFSPGTVQGNRQLNETVGGMQLMAGAATAVSGLDMRVFSETWAEPVITQLLKMEQYYENDLTILGIAAQKAKLLPKFGISEINDEFLMQELILKINVGIGSADPEVQIQKFNTGADIVQKIFGEAAAPLLDFQEINKEIWGNLGYRDGSRFIKPDGPDPVVQQLQQQLQALQQKLERKEIENQTKLEIGRMQSLSRILTQVVESMGNLEEGEQQFQYEQLKQISGMMQMITQEQMRADTAREGRAVDYSRALDVENLRGAFSVQQAKETAKNRPAANGAGR
jgi:hypothetical protein